MGRAVVQGQHPRHQGKTDLDRLGKEDKVAVLLISIPDVDEMLETLQFQRQYPDLLKEVRLMQHLYCSA